MSAIIAGKSCKGCGKEYYSSFGHPKWFDDVMKKRKQPGEYFKAYIKFQKSGKCPNCYLSGCPDHDWRKSQ